MTKPASRPKFDCCVVWTFIRRVSVSSPLPFQVICRAFFCPATHTMWSTRVKNDTFSFHEGYTVLIYTLYNSVFLLWEWITGVTWLSPHKGQFWLMKSDCKDRVPQWLRTGINAPTPSNSFTYLRGWIMATAISCFANNKSCSVCLRVNTQIFWANSQAAKERGAGLDISNYWSCG